LNAVRYPSGELVVFAPDKAVHVNPSLPSGQTHTSKLSVMFGTQQNARQDAGLWVEALNRRQPIANAIS